MLEPFGVSQDEEVTLPAYGIEILRTDRVSSDLAEGVRLERTLTSS